MNGHEAITAEDQSDLQARVESLAYILESDNSPTVEERIKRLLEAWDALHFSVVRARDDSRLDVETQTGEPGFDWNAVKEDLLRSLIQKSERSSLVPSPPEAESRNILLSRLGTDPSESNWWRAVVFAGRRISPVRGAAPGFLTREFLLSEKVADMYVLQERGLGNAFGSYQPVRSAACLETQLRGPFGENVSYAVDKSEIVISGIKAKEDWGDYTTQWIAEVCISRFFGEGASERICLKRIARLPMDSCIIDEFGIIISTFPVYGRKVSVKRLPRSNYADARLPLGWWWSAGQLRPPLSPETCVAKALDQERLRQPTVSDLKADLIATVVWPEEPSGRVAHQVHVYSERGTSATYFINSQDGLIIRRDDSIRH